MINEWDENKYVVIVLNNMFIKEYEMIQIYIVDYYVEYFICILKKWRWNYSQNGLF